MKTTTQLKIINPWPHQKWDSIIIPKGTRVTVKSRPGDQGNYHEVIDVAKVASMNETNQDKRRELFKQAVYHPIRIDSKFVGR